MTPEIKVFLVSAAAIAFAYTALYPRLPEKTLGKMVMLDVILSALLLLAVGWVYYGTGTVFSLLLFDVPWWVFTLLAAALVEGPFFLWFCKKWNIDLNPPMD
ncbi:hypothetical protein [uncultured Sulfitobacter sp.]|uniref:hypothetical protein n=1 Tax=uncultured Sulfitobacter sp. TaxID=191468 RepID=UPI00262741D9|nr:hypothetical protein [uncultured Sulfitobacter sp.]